MVQELQEIVCQLTGIDDVFFFKLAEDLGFCEELLQVILENKEIRIVEGKPQAVLRNIKGRSVTLDLKRVDGDGIMCDLVQAYAEKYANKEKIKILVLLFIDGTLN